MGTTTEHTTIASVSHRWEGEGFWLEGVELNEGASMYSDHPEVSTRFTAVEPLVIIIGK